MEMREETGIMSKYNELWEYVGKKEDMSFKLTFAQVQDILGFEIDHSF